MPETNDPIRLLETFGTGGVDVSPLDPTQVRRLGDRRRSRRRAALVAASAVVVAAGGRFAVQAFAQGLAGLEEGQALRLDRHVFAGARVAAHAGIALFHRKRAEATQFDPVALGQRIGDFVEDGVDDFLDVAHI